MFAPGFYANHDTKTPFKIALLCVAINLALNLALIRPFAHVGMAMATSIASWVNLGLMVYLLHKRGVFKPDALLKRRLSRLIAATLVMALAVWFAGHLSQQRLEGDTFARSMALLLIVAVGGKVFFAAAFTFGAYDIAAIKRVLKRKPYAEKP